jgi:bacteriocin-like protein
MNANTTRMDCELTDEELDLVSGGGMVKAVATLVIAAIETAGILACELALAIAPRA